MVQCDNQDIPLSSPHGIRTMHYLGNIEVATTPNHHVPRPDDQSATDGVQSEANSGDLMGTMEAPSTIQRRQPGVVRRTKHSHVTPHRKVSTKMIQPLSHYQGAGTGNIPTLSPRTVEHSSSVSRGPPYTI